MKIEIINQENNDIFEALVDGVRQYNFQHMGTEQSQPLSVVAYNDEGKLIAGVSGRTIYQQFLIIAVWVDQSLRGTGLGRQLMQQAEIEAIKRGCKAAQLDTLSFQAPLFYQKLGFEIVGQVEAIAASPARYFMLKKYA